MWQARALFTECEAFTECEPPGFGHVWKLCGTAKFRFAGF